MGLKKEIPEEILEFIAKWAAGSGQSVDAATRRFWDLMIDQDLEDTTKSSVLDGWAKEAGVDFRTKP